MTARSRYRRQVVRYQRRKKVASWLVRLAAWLNQDAVMDFVFGPEESAGQVYSGPPNQVAERGRRPPLGSLHIQLGINRDGMLKVLKKDDDDAILNEEVIDDDEDGDE